jgi:hypothetical protein
MVPMEEDSMQVGVSASEINRATRSFPCEYLSMVIESTKRIFRTRGVVSDWGGPADWLDESKWVS